MNHATPENLAPVPAKAGAGASYTTAARVRRVRVPTPRELGDDDRQLVVRMLDVASDTAARVVIVLTEVDGFALVDAAAIAGVPPLQAREICRGCRQVAVRQLAAERRAMFKNSADDPREIAPAEQRPRVTKKSRGYGRPVKRRDVK